MKASEITGLILAGGQARRMGGRDKGLLPYQDGTLISHVIARLAPQVGGLLINANRSLPDYAALGYPVVPDVIGGFAGPLAGLHAGLRACPTPWLVTAPCDAPFLADDLVRCLAAAACRQHRLAVAVSPRGIEPGFMLCHRDLTENIAAYLAGGGRKVQDWLAANDAAHAAFAAARAFVNINTPEELACCAGASGGLAQA